MNIKYGIDVKTNSDLQNLVTSVILRQTDSFTEETIFSEVLKKLDGSVFANSPDVKKRCDNTLNTLFSIGSIKFVSDGAYILSIGFPSIKG